MALPSSTTDVSMMTTPLIKQNLKSFMWIVFINHENYKMSEITVASKYGFNYFKLQDPGNCLQIKPFQAELEKSRIEDKKSVVNSVNEVRSDFETLKFEVRNITGNINTDYLRQKMLNIEEKISRSKESIKEELLTLLREEENLLKDLHFIEKKTEEWGKSVNVKISTKHSSPKVSKTNDRNPTTEFQEFLFSSGGHYGGWEEQDHFLFLKERTKYKGKKKFLSALHCLLSDLSYEEIEKHEKWYQKYQCLRNSQKEAIKKWKLEKEVQKVQKERDENKYKKKQSKKPVRHQINIAERIKQWKNQQLLRKLEEEERQKKEKERLKEEEKRRKEMQEIKKLAVTKYKAEKLSKTQEIFYKEENSLQKREAKAKNKILLKAFRLQDLKFIEKKKIIRLQLESKLNDQSEKLKLAKPALEFILQRNPSRIFQPTLIWSQHCLESQKKEKLDPVFDLNSIPRLAIPEWRRELK